MKVAVRCEKHSPIFGQHASWQTECNFSSLKIALVRKYSGETGARTLIQSGCFRSAIGSAQAWRVARRDDRAIAEDVGKVTAHRRAELGHGYRLGAGADALVDRRHAASFDFAGDDGIEVAQIGGYVERETVIGDPAPDTDADRGNLARADPDAGQSGAAAGV